jgi:2-C-methyl-D-erythritol 4-phosphate cytidylyltransferase / 2-C-methyl-D-erythritol 2,4-cyclodiphosphate synthase
LSGPAEHPIRADAIVVAAGSSRRMAGLDKLQATIAGRPLLSYALDGLVAAQEVESIIIVTSATQRPMLAETSWLPAKVRGVVVGGDRRQDSVVAGFVALEEHIADPSGDRVVLVHDGARPLVNAGLVSAVVRATAAHGAAIPVVPVVETLKRIDDDGVRETVDREHLALAQTPQGVRRSILRSAFADPRSGGTWTDEAALLEACRIAVHVVPGDPSNLKVTMPADLVRAAAALAPTGPSMRTGVGVDTHPFGPGAPLQLGGLTFDGVPRLVGHSDGDVALHAVADALLGAAALGDLGRHFPADASTPHGIAGITMLAAIVDRLAETGWRAHGIDLTIVAARPRLGDRCDAMRSVIADTLSLGVDRVSVKASTGNLDGSEGAGRTVSAVALVTVEPIA